MQAAAFAKSHAGSCICWMLNLFLLT